MPATYTRAGFFRCAFLHDAPRRYAVTLTPAQAHYHTNQRMLDAWSAVDAHARLLPLERDAGGITALRAYPGMAQSDPHNSSCTVAGRNAAFRVSGIGAGVDSNAALRRHNNR